MGRPKLDPVKNFMSKVDRAGDCWIWTGYKKKYGHGLCKVSGKTRIAHRYSYEINKGPIPDGMELDHLCRNPPCVNPAHLEPVTQRENNRRSNSVPSVNARKTHCKRGHEFDERNTVRSKAGRTCRICTNAAAREYQRRKRAVVK